MEDLAVEGLAGVAVGDSIFVTDNHSGSIGRVKRITPRGYVVVEVRTQEYTFRPDGSERSSDAWNRRRARRATDEDRRQIRLRNLQVQVARDTPKKADTLTAEQCKQILAILWPDKE